MLILEHLKHSTVAPLNSDYQEVSTSFTRQTLKTRNGEIDAHIISTRMIPVRVCIRVSTYLLIIYVQRPIYFRLWPILVVMDSGQYPLSVPSGLGCTLVNYNRYKSISEIYRLFDIAPLGTQYHWVVLQWYGLPCLSAVQLSYRNMFLIISSCINVMFQSNLYYFWNEVYTKTSGFSYVILLLIKNSKFGMLSTLMPF